MKDITPRNEKGYPHGLWELYFSDGSVMSKRFFNNGKKIGYEEYYYSWDNKVMNKKYYI